MAAPRWILAVSACLVLIHGVRQADGGCVQPREIDECPMIDYKVYSNLDQEEAAARAGKVAGEQVAAWRASRPQKAKGKKKGKAHSLDFCEDLIRATVCNLLVPPCEGGGKGRYRKPCKAYEEAIRHGCGWELRMGDLSFAEPPDCYELPVRSYKEVSGYADAAALGSESFDGAGASSRADDLIELSKVLFSASESEYAVHLLLQALRYRPDDAHAHQDIYSALHAVFEERKSLQLQLNMTGPSDDGVEACLAGHRVDKRFKQHKGISERQKVEYILELATQRGSRYMVETGTWYGETINNVKGHFEKIVSIEISAQLADHARMRFEKDLNIQILTGDSLVELPKVIKQRDRGVPTLFWLDGHFSGSRFETAKAELDTPIMIELDAVMRDVTDDDVVMIDDARLFRGYGDCGGDYRSECYPSLKELRKVVCRHRPGWVFEVEDDLMRIHSGGGAPPAPGQGKQAETKADAGAGWGVPTGTAPKVAAPSFGGGQPKKAAPSFGAGPKKAAPSFGGGQPPPTHVQNDDGAFHVKL